MGEAKRRGTKEQRVQEGIAKRFKTQEQLNAQLELLQRRKAAMEQTLPPMDKLAIQQRQMLAEAARNMTTKVVSIPDHQDVGVPINESETSNENDEIIPTLTDVVEESVFFEPIEHVAES